MFLAQALLKKFSGKGLVPDALTAQPAFLLAVALGAGITVILGTFLGFPYQQLTVSLARWLRRSGERGGSLFQRLPNR